MPFQPPADTLTYEPYFGLNEKPFSLNADPRFVYNSPTYASARQGLLAGIRRREGLLVLTGEIGTGKTTLCRAVLENLGRNTYSSLVPDPFASREDLLKMLLIDFGVLSIQDLTAGSLRQATRTELGYLLSGFLDSLAADAFVVVMIDEAQNLSLPLIEETRLLSDTFGAKGRMQIVFVGQPELHAKLKLPEMRQVDQRVCGYHRLAPMDREAVAGYVQHRLQAAGCHRNRVLFPPEIIDGLHRRTGGVPRLVNRVCDRALHLACERQAERVNTEILESALTEVGSVTLSPTWDSIIFAEPPTPPAAPAPPAAPVATAVPPATAAVDAASPIDEDDDFNKQIEQWVAQELTPPPRALTQRDVSFDAAPPKSARQRRPPPGTTRREAAARSVTTDWPRDLRSETYMHRLWRISAKWAAITAAAAAALGAVMLGASLLAGALAPPVLPVLPEATRLAVPGIALPGAPPADAPASLAADPSGAVSGEYFVAVGVFVSRDRADQLVGVLTQAGLPAMQRPSQLRGQRVQQIVLGPYFSRADAALDLRRLQQLAGYEDATVIDGAPDSVVPQQPSLP